MSSKFKKMIKDFTDYHEWEVEWGDGYAHIDYEAESGETYTIICTEYEDVIEFDIPSSAAFDSEDEIPDEISTILLKRNARLPFIAWALEKLADEKWYFSIMFSTTLELLESTEYDELDEDLGALVEECDAFERIWQSSN